MRWLPIGLALATALAALALFQGMVTAGLVPLAVFGPAYALARSLEPGDEARRHAARVVVAASAGVGLALLPAVGMADGIPRPDWARAGLTVVAAGTGALAAIAATPKPPTDRHEDRRWSFIHALEQRHARGLALLAGVAVPAGTLVALLREAPIARLGEVARTLPEAVFGAYALQGAIVLPDPSATVAVAIPLSVAPIALGFLTSPKRSAPLALGGLAVLALAPVAVYFEVPVRASTGAWVPVSVVGTPGLAALEALAPSALGLLVGGGAVTVARRRRFSPRALRATWAGTGALLAIPIWGWLSGLVLALTLAASALVVAVTTRRAQLGLALLVGAGLGGLAHLFLPIAASWALGVLVGVGAGSAGATYASSISIEAPGGGLRSPWTLAYLLVAVAAVGLLVAVAPDIVGSTPFPAPHARGLHAGLAALVEGRSLLLIVWGLAAGGLVQAFVGRGAWIGLGALAGPGVAGLVLVGSLLRALWEKGLLDRAREGYVMRGQLGYELLRVHVLVAAVLAGEALAIAIAAVLG